MVQCQQNDAIVAKGSEGGVEGRVVALGADVVQAHVLQRAAAADDGPEHGPGDGGLLRRALRAAGQGRHEALQGPLLFRPAGVALGVVGVVQVEVRAFAQQQAEFIRLVGQRV
ncbi:hypothetical protein G6F40_016775 [Rhizopus arrhizus]|nr:hypothetical protein G6F40_016775 [Rhizopus arrhizus]